MWKPEHRRAADRRGLRYPSDLTNAEWALVAPLIRPAKRGGRPRTVNVREVLNAIFYVLWTGCQWTALPRDLPPRSTVWDYLDRWAQRARRCGTARCRASITHSTSRCASEQAATPARPRPSSTARVPKVRQRGRNA